MPQPAAEYLLLALNDPWTRYHSLLRACRRKTGRRDVHELRVTLRRLISILELIGELSDPREVRPLRSEFKKQVRALRDLRDLQVQEKALPAPGAGARLPGFRGFLRDRRKAEAARVRRRLRKVERRELALEKLAVDELLAALARGARRPGALTARLDGALRRRFATLEMRAKRARPNDLEAVHAARIQFKNYRYTREALAGLVPLSDAASHRLKGFQDLLGGIQDTAVLMASLRNFLATKASLPERPELQAWLGAEARRQRRLLTRFQAGREWLLAGIRPPRRPSAVVHLRLVA